MTYPGGRLSHQREDIQADTVLLHNCKRTVLIAVRVGGCLFEPKSLRTAYMTHESGAGLRQQSDT